MRSERLTIPAAIYDEMIVHARELLPEESCGYLAGREGVVNKFIHMTNSDHAHDHFTFDPKEQFTAVKDMRNNGLDLLAVYHSHPESPARLSEEDKRLLKDPNMIYIIVSLQQSNADIKAFRLEGSDYHPVDIIKEDTL